MRGISRPIAESAEQSENCGHHAPPSSVYALTVLEAAEIATIGRSTLYKYIRSGALPVRRSGLGPSFWPMTSSPFSETALIFGHEQ